MKMARQAQVIWFMVALGLGHPIVGWSLSPAVFTGAPIQHGSPSCVLDGTRLGTAGTLRLAAAVAPKANMCLEECARLRQRCEQQDSHRPGTRENVAWSKQCQGRYNQCRDGCH